MNIRDIIDVLKTDVARKSTIMIWGPPGIGKSASVRAAAAELGGAAGSPPLPVIDMRLTQLDPTDLKGIPVPVPVGPDQVPVCTWASPSALPRTWRDGPEGFLLLDEINSAPQLVQAAAYELTLDRRLGDYVVPDGWRIICAGNRRGDGGITYKMPTPLANRMIHLEAEPSLEAWKTWAYDRGFHDSILAFLTCFPDRLLDFDPSKSETAFPTPRSWEMANRILMERDLPQSLRDDMLRGCVGSGTTSDFLAYLKLEADLPDIDAILLGDPDAHRIPGSPSAKYMVVVALVSRLRGQKDKRPLMNTLKYVMRLPQEFTVLFFQDVLAHVAPRDQKLRIWLAENPDFIAWTKDNVKSLSRGQSRT